MANSDTNGVHLWLILMKAHQSLQRHAMLSIAGMGLCFSDFAVLEILLHKGPLPVNVLGARVSLTSGSATAAIDRLERKQLVRRQLDVNDRRAKVVHLTAKGRNLIEKAFREHTSDMERASCVLTAEEKATLSGLLRKLGKFANSDLEISAKGEKHVRKDSENRSR
jgi:MarR family transcriptional regulator, 2-MHQ and catechol-resistance regulon repressor